MIVKILIFLCSVYVVHAYVAINIFDDDADRQVTPRMDLDESPVISDCSPLGCAQLCRRIGLKGGVCVHGKCKCDLFIDSAVSDTDDSQAPLTRCDLASCNRGCRSIGYPGGRCISSECRCDPRSVKHDSKNVNASGTDETQTLLMRCDSSSCYRGCHSIGYPGGHCVGSECRCDPRYERKNIKNVDGATETPLEKCHSSSCNLKCRNLGFIGGFCIAKRCICIPRSAKAEDSNLIISSDGDVQEMKLENPAPMLSDCNIVACEQLCRRIFLKGGSCVNGQCKCDIISDTTESNEVPLTKNEDKDEETALNDDQKSLVGRCFTSQCIQMCRQIGFTNGRCDYRDACICY